MPNRYDHEQHKDQDKAERSRASSPKRVRQSEDETSICVGVASVIFQPERSPREYMNWGSGMWGLSFGLGMDDGD